MKSEKKVMICSVLTLLQERDPEWKHPAMIKNFKTVYDGWRQAELRAQRHTAAYYSRAWKRGWLSQADFVSFRNFALQ